MLAECRGLDKAAVGSHTALRGDRGWRRGLADVCEDALKGTQSVTKAMILIGSGQKSGKNS
jgi:hypothetical protein